MSTGVEKVSGSSPASTGPAGARFEGQVGAHYLLTMLAASEPRGLPGTSITSIALQRGDDGFPLDDVIVHATEITTGCATTLQIQVKRSIAFSPSDPVFKKVVGQIAEAIITPGFWTGRNELAIATAGSSRKIDGPYQDVLRWARQLASAEMFFERLNRPGTASDDMRTFVLTLRDHLRDAGGQHDDETVWKVLSRLQILVFDYTAVGSASETLAYERSLRVLPPEDSERASTFWNILVDLAEEIAADGGDRDNPRLLSDLNLKSISVAPHPRLRNVRAAVAEASSQALADINTRVGSTALARTERVEAINLARDQGRYIEIRGDAGVGKSGLLKHFAELFSAEGQILVLSPGRIPQRGWTTMRGLLNFNGTARELLSDLMCDGGAALFIDNVDSFNDEERLTANDLLRAASEVPGLIVLVSARRNFATEEPSWLDQQAISKLVATTPIVIDELSALEVAELSAAEPQLSVLLDDKNPARNVARNLYRLSRLAKKSITEPAPTSELDMADQWWQSADGDRGTTHRERARILRRLAEAAFTGAFSFDVSGEPSAPLDALIRSETLRDLGADKVTFRHDILRQWAVGCLLFADPSAYEKLPLSRPAPAVLARGVELAARFTLVRDVTGEQWAGILATLSRPGNHGSWRRSALLALAHGDTARILLDRETERLLENKAELLRELMQTVMAVDVEPASQIFADFGIASDAIPANLFVPANASWQHLLIRLMKLGTRIPAQALSTIAEFYTQWMVGTLGQDAATPHILYWLHTWLVELESEHTHATSPISYSGQFAYGEADGLTDTLRTGFLAFCNKAPDLAVDYLNRVRAYKYDRGIVKNIMSFRGTLAQAAPKELAALTAEKLISKRAGRTRSERSERDTVFEYLDLDFMPSASTKGPFLELLTHSPEDGLGLIRMLIDHAVNCRTGGRDPEGDGFTITLSDGDRFFPWTATYRLSRGISGDYAMTSGLMALAAWAEKRIEKGAPFTEVLADIIGPPGSACAYILVAVDLIISFWPHSHLVAIPLLGCPELLCADRIRQAQDQIDWRLANSADAPASLNVPLEELFGTFACQLPANLRLQLRDLLETASKRLGPPEPDSNFRDPRFMAQHALYLVDPCNWKESKIEQPDGTNLSIWNYVPPESEAQHLAPLTAHLPAERANTNVLGALLMAVDAPSQSSQELARDGVAWAKAQLAKQNLDSSVEAGLQDSDATFTNNEGIRAAALVILRDGDDDLHQQHDEWAERILVEALKSPEDSVHRLREGLKFNPIAMAFAGLAELYRRHPTRLRLKTLLEIAARTNPAAAHGFASVAPALAAIDERIPQGIIRCALAACVKPNTRWDVSESDAVTRKERYTKDMAECVEAELAWMNDDSKVPRWPDFEPDGARVNRTRRRGVHIGGEPKISVPLAKEASPNIYIDDQAASLWIKALHSITDVSKRPWLRDVVDAYANFSGKLNGVGLGPAEEVSQVPDSWNEAYYPLAARTLAGLPQADINSRVQTYISQLPDHSFFDIVTPFLLAVDTLYFNAQLLKAEAPIIRQAFVHRLTTTVGWAHVVGQDSSSTEIHIAPAIATIFFNTYGLRTTQTYLTAKGIDQIGPFLADLTTLLGNSPSYFVAIVTMDLVEVSPRVALLPMLLAGALAWINTYGDDPNFWIGMGIGRRLCAWLDKVRASEPKAIDSHAPERLTIDTVLAALVRLGLPEARLLEMSLASDQIS